MTSTHTVLDPDGSFTSLGIRATSMRHVIVKTAAITSSVRTAPRITNPLSASATMAEVSKPPAFALRRIRGASNPPLFGDLRGGSLEHWQNMRHPHHPTTTFGSD